MMDNFNIYQSANSDKESIKKNFIVRRTEFEIIMDALSNKKPNDPLQHELILGRRGSGKSTLLKRIEIEIEEQFEEKYIPVNLAEEQASIYRLSDLWTEVINELQCRFEETISLRNFSEFKKEQDYTRYLYLQIHEYCVSHKKQIVLLLDNFDRIVENLNDDGNLLRETLINYNDMAIIGASTRMDEHFWQYDMPFYEFFRRHHLNALKIDEIINLFNHWSDTLDLPELGKFVKNNPGKIQSIRIITDGMPRTLLFFIQLVIQNNYAEEGVDYLKKIMDHTTPLYQERLNYLPSQLRKVVSEMAFIWEACTAKELADKCRMKSNVISAGLKTLTEKGITEKIETDKRNMLYRISERFFNMWLIMTQGNPEQKRKAKWLSIFLETWYSADELKSMAQQHIENLRNKNIDAKRAFVLSKALSQSKYISVDERDQIIELTSAETVSINLLELPALYKIIANQIEEAIDISDFKRALDLAESIENESDGVKYFFCGLIYDLQSNLEQAERYYLLAIEKGHVDAMFNLAFLYKNQKKYDEAERYYLLAIEKGDVDAMVNLGLLYKDQEKYEEAERYYLLAIEKGHVKAMFNLGLLYQNQEKYEQAERYYLLAIEKGHVKALLNLASLYKNQEKYEEAERYYLLAIEKGHVIAMFNLGLLYKNQEKYEQAERYYLLAIEKGDVDAMYNLALLYYQLNIKKSEALNYFKQSNEKNKVKDEFLMILEIWNGVFNDPKDRMVNLVKNGVEELDKYIIHLLIHQQKTLLLNLFNHPDIGKELQDKYNILYYVCLFLNDKTENNLSLKIPPEIQTTVQEIIAFIEEKERFYGYKK